MKQLIILSSIFAALYNGVACASPPSGKIKRDTTTSGFYNFLPYNAHVKFAHTQQPQQVQGQGLAYFKGPAVQSDASGKPLQYPQQSVAIRPAVPESNTPVNLQYQTIPPQAAPGMVGQLTGPASTATQAQYFVSPQHSNLLQVPAFHQQPLYVQQQQQLQQQNQYTVKQASLPQTATPAGFPPNAFKGFAPVQFPNSHVHRYLAPKPIIYQSLGAVPQIHAKQVLTRPLVNHQIYHQPLHTAIKSPVVAQVSQAVTSPLTDRPVKEDIQEHDEDPAPENPERQQEQEEEEQQQQEEEDEERDNYKQEEESEEEYFKPPKYRFESIFKNEDDGEVDRGFYRRQKNEHDEGDSDGCGRPNDRYSESRPVHSKLSSKYWSPSNKEGYSYYEGGKTGSDYKKPKVEYKMYQYSRSAKMPRRSKDSEAKESVGVPEIHASKNLYEAKWMITKTSSNTQ